MPPRFQLLALLIACSLMLACQPEHLSPFPEQDAAALPDTIPVAQLHADVDTLFAGLARTHPELDARLSPATADSLRRALIAQVTGPMTRRAFFRVIGAVTAELRDGHSGVLYPYPEFDREAAAGARVFPLLVEPDGPHLVVRRDRGDTARVPRGARLHRIATMDADSLLAAFAQYARGETPALRAQIVAEDFARWLWHLSGAPQSWTVVWEHANRVDTATIAGIPLASLEQADAGRSADRPTFRVIGRDAGYLDVPWFGGEDAFMETLERAVDTARARALAGVVIDLRRNPGGSTDLVEALLSRITTRECALVSSVRERITPRNRRWWRPTQRVGTVITMPDNEVVSPAAADARFPGHAAILIGPFTYSAAIVMATAAQDCGAATLVGTPTGGFANQTAQIHFANLPHSRLRWFAPSRVLRRPRGAERGGPVLPDVPVTSDVVAGGDPALDTAVVTVRRATRREGGAGD